MLHNNTLNNEPRGSEIGVRLSHTSKHTHAHIHSESIRILVDKISALSRTTPLVFFIRLIINY